MQELKELIKLSSLCNLQLFASSIEGNIRHQKLRNCWVARKLMSRTSPVKFEVFRREFLWKHWMNWTQICRENLNCYALSIFKVFILLASSGSDKHMLMRRKVQRLAYLLTSLACSVIMNTYWWCNEVIERHVCKLLVGLEKLKVEKIMS